MTVEPRIESGGGLLSQPRAVAFAAVVSFMGLGLVDPILPAIAKNLDASPSQVELLFTSYFAFTGISMLVSSFVASRIGAKRTLLAGLVLIIAFSAAAGASNTIGASRPIASSAYSFVRFCGGAVAPFVAGKLGEHVSVQAPFYLGAAMTAIGIGVLWTYREALRPVAAAATPPPFPTVRPTPTSAVATPMVLAVAGATSRQVSALAAPLARARGAAVHVVHVIESDVLAGEDTADLETPTHAQALLDGCIAELDEAGVPVTGELLRSYGTHADVAAQILQRAADLGAGLIVLGPETRHAASSGVNAYIARPCAQPCDHRQPARGTSRPHPPR